MKRFEHWLGALPVRTKLMLLASLASGMALILAGIVLTLTDYQANRRALVQRLQVQAEIGARNWDEHTRLGHISGPPARRCARV